MLNEIIKQLKEVCKEQNLDVSENCLLEQGVKIMISNNINQSKKENIKSMSNYQNEKIIKPQVSNDEITPKQKAFLIKIKKYQDGMTKQQAFTIISNLKNKGGEY